MRMLWFFTVCSIWLGLPVVSVYSKDAAVINIDEDQTVLAYYKAGLHPIHLKQFESSRVELMSTRDGLIEFRLGGFIIGPVLMESATLRMWNDARPTQVNLNVKPLATSEVKRLLYEWVDLLGIGQQEIDDAVDRVTEPDAFRLAADFPTAQIGPGGIAGENFLVGVRVAHAYLEDEVGVQIRLSIRYPTVGLRPVELQPIDQPLSPPPGYEHLPMERELAEAMWDNERGAAGALDDGSGQSEEEPAAIQQHQNDASRNSSGTAGNAEVQGFIGSASFWLLWSGLIICLIGWLVARGRR